MMRMGQLVANGQMRDTMVVQPGRLLKRLLVIKQGFLWDPYSWINHSLIRWSPQQRQSDCTSPSYMD